MKAQHLKQNIVIAIVVILSSIKLSTSTAATMRHCAYANIPTVENTVSDDPNFRVTVLKNGSEINVHISLNVNEGTTGVLTIYNALGQTVSKNEIQLKQQPLFHNLNLNEYADGTYTFELTTNTGVHYTHPVF